MNNCYVKVVGGLGNQLFQIAAGYAYAKKYDKRLVIDSTQWCAGQGSHVLSFKDTIFKNFDYESSSITRDTIGIYEKEFNYLEIPFNYGNVMLNGYFQSLKYFDDCQEEFKNKLNLPKIKSPKDLTKKNVGFHIRRGDYLKYPDIHYVCKTDYFDKCFAYFNDHEIDVFTDSPEYVLDEFKHQKFNLIRSNSELEDLALLSQYNNIVCSNSTFSWWASFLGNEDKLIIVPNKWFMNDMPHEDIYRPDMIKFEA